MPFLALLGAVASNPANKADIQLLKRVLSSLEAASQHAQGAGKIHDVCHILFHTATKSLRNTNDATFSNEAEQAEQAAANNPRSQSSASVSGDGKKTAGAASLAETATFDTDGLFDSNMPDTNFQDMSHLFEDFLGGTTSMLDMFDVDPMQAEWNWDNT